jgi:flagellar biosynthetic protein FliQ
MSMGMMMMSPAIVSLPFKLMLFVLVDGWSAADRVAGRKLLLRPRHDTRKRNDPRPASAMEVTLMIAAPMLLHRAGDRPDRRVFFKPPRRSMKQTLTFIPKLVGVFIALIVAGPWMLSVMLDYMRLMFTGIPAMVQ